MQGASPLASPGLNPGGTGKGGEPRARRGLVPVGCQLTLPLWCPAGACPLCRLPPLPFRHPQGGLAFLLACQPCLWFTFLPPIPPTPFPGGEGGDQGFFHARGSAPCIPGAEPGRHWLALPIRHPAGVCLRNLQPGAKPKEPPFHEKCRQPRRGGTGGDGTIRRKRRRRLRWSSPPGQG